MSAKFIDSFEFCRHKQQQSGQTPIAEMARLSVELADSQGELRWSLTGGAHPTGVPQLKLEVAGEVRLMCQRCLTPYMLPIATNTVLVLARDDAQADETEAMLDDDSIDVIVGSTTLDVLALVEDDALLALPLSPRHDVCPDGAEAAVVKDKKESPFAVLKKLKS